MYSKNTDSNIRNDHTIKYIDYKTLLILNDKAIKAKFNRSLVHEKLVEMSDRIKKNLYPLVQTFDHNDSEIRCRIILDVSQDPHPQTFDVWLDMTYEDYKILPSMTHINVA